ncbi:hypothetical protein [Streptococcus uberis]|uniref:hypothetical protein n=1 Tax=Streptococcus uberis TaxID=1349 RepID=UPI00193A8D48|nr:hypothetical protein [Streptococcus uberis]
MKKKIFEKKIIIVLPTHSNYLELISNFLQVFNENWPDCPFEIVISITGEDKCINGYDCLYNGKNASLIDCLVSVSNLYNPEYIISFLGDAFITKKINNDDFFEILNFMSENIIHYCSIRYVRNYWKKKNASSKLRFIHQNDRYSHNFVSFIVDQYYMSNTIKNFQSDLEFEQFYLHNQIGDDYYKHDVIVSKNIFNINPAINKGKWNRKVRKKLIKKYPNIEFIDLPKESIGDTIINGLRNKIIYYLTPKTRKLFKLLLLKVLGKEFVTKD